MPVLSGNTRSSWSSQWSEHIAFGEQLSALIAKYYASLKDAPIYKYLKFRFNTVILSTFSVGIRSSECDWGVIVYGWFVFFRDYLGHRHFAQSCKQIATLGNIQKDGR